MTFRTVISKFIIMNVLVASCAILEWNIRKPLKFFLIPDLHLMTFDTFDIAMFPYEYKVSIIMTKITRRGKCFIIMAFGTIL